MPAAYALVTVAPRGLPVDRARIGHAPKTFPAMMSDADADLWQLRCEATDFVDDGCPPWIRVRLLDPDGREWLFEDKTPMFGDADDITSDTALPAPVSIWCRILGERGGGVVDIEVDRGRPEAQDGTIRFQVRRDQLRR